MTQQTKQLRKTNNNYKAKKNKAHYTKGYKKEQFEGKTTGGTIWENEKWIP